MSVRFITFYSYKGGVGRTFALTNIAVLLAQWGHRVLCVDWDLEAPGAHLYFRPYLEQGEPRGGLVDMLTSFAEGTRTRELQWRSWVTEVHIPDRESPGHLDFLAAGRTADDRYMSAVQTIDWDGLYANHDLGDAIEHMREALLADYDFVLVDSRTGITDTGGICTVQLPDALVMLGTANEQSIGGLCRVIDAALSSRDRLHYDRGRQLVMPVLARFEPRVEHELSEEWANRFASEMQRFIEPWLPSEGVDARKVFAQLRMPSVPFWSFGERLPVVSKGIEDPDDIGYVFASMAAVLAHGFEGIDRFLFSRESYLDQAWSVDDSLDVFVGYSVADQDYARELNEELKARGLRTFFYDVDVDAGGNWREEVFRAIDRTQSFVFLLRAKTSRSQEFEIDRAIRRVTTGQGGRLIPVVMDDDSDLLFRRNDLLSSLRAEVRGRRSPEELARDLKPMLVSGEA